MKRIYTFSTVLMNGTVTMNSQTAAFASRDLAEQTRRDVMEANRDADIAPLTCLHTDVTEVCVYETTEEIPFYINKHKKETL